jgi:hypothetical protein
MFLKSLIKIGVAQILLWVRAMNMVRWDFPYGNVFVNMQTNWGGGEMEFISNNAFYFYSLNRVASLRAFFLTHCRRFDLCFQRRSLIGLTGILC